MRIHFDAIIVLGNVVHVPSGGMADDVPIGLGDERVICVASLFNRDQGEDHITKRLVLRCPWISSDVTLSSPC